MTITGSNIMEIIKFIDYLCKKFKLQKYSYLQQQVFLLKKYAPIEALHTLDDSPGKVYVWQLRKEINDIAFTTRMGKILTQHNLELKALHVFTSDLDGVKKLPPDEVKILLEHYYSDDAQQGGRKR